MIPRQGPTDRRPGAKKIIMFKNYFKIALRNISRNKFSSIINISGLAIGLASAIFIFLYVQDELRYDSFIKDANRIYQVNIDGKMGGEEILTGNTPPPVGAALMKSFPEIKTYTRIFRPGDVIVRSETKNQPENYFTETTVFAVDSNFLEVFNYEILKGDPATCLLDPSSVVITNKIAKKYFGNADAVGQILLIGNEKKPFKVSAILKDIPSQSSFQFNILRPIASYPVVSRFSWSWVWLQVNTYVKLHPTFQATKENLKSLESKFPAMVQQQAASAFERIGQPLDELKKKGGKWDLHLHPFLKLHLYSGEVGARITNLGDIKYVRIFSLIALFIIILACVNFMNLSTAQSAKRAKEVGIRKTLGSPRLHLIRQFFGEALVFVMLSGSLALLMVILLLQPFNQLAGKELSFALLYNSSFWLYFMAAIVFTTLLAGSYPALYLTSFNPISVIKGKLTRVGLGSLFLRNGMVVFQFTISTALIICTIIVYQQLQYARNVNPGFTKENTIIISNSNRLGNNENVFNEEISQIPEVANSSITSSIPTKNWFGDRYEPEANGDQQVAKDVMLASFLVDEAFVPSMEMQILKGRNFSKAFKDSGSVIINETAARELGWKDPIGKFMTYPGNANQRFQVIGIVKDFNFESLRNIILPFALFHKTSNTYNIGTSYIIARIKPGRTQVALAKLKEKWHGFSSDTPFDYSFLDQEFNSLYKSDAKTGSVFGLFTMLSIFVACLGLFGLAAFTAERRIKEIGVRKVLGASIHGLVGLLSKDFIKLVFWAALIAFPLAWWTMNNWLSVFAYRIEIEWWVFVVAAAGAMSIALITVSFQAIKAALMNPVKSLRSE